MSEDLDSVFQTLISFNLLERHSVWPRSCENREIQLLKLKAAILIK